MTNLLPPTGRGRVLVFGSLAVCALLGTAFWRRGSVDPSLVVNVRRGELTATLTTSGTLRSIQSLTYRSPVVGREVEIRDLAPEGTRVNEGDLLVRLDSTEVEREIDRVRQDLRQSQMDLDVAAGEWDEADATVKAVSEGEGALTVEEARTRLQLAQKKVDRLRRDYDQLKPLLDKGFITRDELAKTSDLLEQSEEELGLARKRTEVLLEMTHPRETKRAALQLAQKAAQLGRARARVQETETRLTLLHQLLDACTLYARGRGMVVYEDYLNANPRRKIRVGDRVTSSQGIVTISEVSRMLVDASVGESEVHRVSPGQKATVRAEAFPDLRLTGKIVRVGTLASSSIYRPLDDKRFDLIIELDPSTADLRPEMTVRADIVVGTRESVLLVPVTAVFERQGTSVAYVVGHRGIETRHVDLGESNDQFVEVVAGLQEGEHLTLTPPPASTSTAPAAAPSTGNQPGGNALQPR